MKPNLPTKPIHILFALLFLGGLVGGGYRYWQSRQATPQPPIIETPPTPGEETPSTPITQPTSDPDWNLYINQKYGFQVEYPSGWEVEETYDINQNPTEDRIVGEVQFFKDNLSYITMSVWNSLDLDLVSWSKNHGDILVWGNSLPSKPDSSIAGNQAFVLYSPDVGQAPSQVTAVFKSGSFIFRISHFTPAGSGPLMWSTYERFLRTFAFAGDEGGTDELPEFPMGQ